MIFGFQYDIRKFIGEFYRTMFRPPLKGGRNITRNVISRISIPFLSKHMLSVLR